MLFTTELYYKRNSIDIDEMNLNDQIILFAGEATHDHYYSTVHGGVETGFREADRLIDFER